MIRVDLPPPETPVTQVKVPSGISTVTFLQIVARARRRPRCVWPVWPVRRIAGTGICRMPVRYCPVRLSGLRMHLLGRALGDDLAAMHAGARAHVDEVVGGADRLLVVLDDDAPCCRDRAAASASRAGARCRAGAARSTARRAHRARRSGPSRSARRAGCAGSRRPTACPSARRASGSRARHCSGSRAAR